MTGPPPSPVDSAEGFATSGDVPLDGGNCQTPGMVHPYGMVAGAIGLGFLLGGGISLRLTARLAGLGLRLGWLAALPAIKRELAHVFTESKSHCNER
jgi:hypothetical protein